MPDLCNLKTLMRESLFEFLSTSKYGNRCNWQFLNYWSLTPCLKMNKKCPNCKLVNFAEMEKCARCQSDLAEVSFSSENAGASLGSKILKRAMACAAVCIIVLFGFYLSLLFTSKSLSYDERSKVKSAVQVLEEKGFSSEASMLKYLTSFRSNDNWLNASTREENAYAATNYPFEIMTVYPDFFNYPSDDVERAAILLHEAQHLKGADEKEAYEFVWKNRKQLGWTSDKYRRSEIWNTVRQRTKEYSPNLFLCNFNDFGDCTE